MSLPVMCLIAISFPLILIAIILNLAIVPILFEHPTAYYRPELPNTLEI